MVFWKSPERAFFLPKNVTKRSLIFRKRGPFPKNSEKTDLISEISEFKSLFALFLLSFYFTILHRVFTSIHAVSSKPGDKGDMAFFISPEEDEIAPQQLFTRRKP